MATRAVHFLTGHYLLLPLGALTALVWANVWPEAYFGITRILAFPVNEIAMVFFFGLIAQEIFEELMPGGALHRWRRWAIPLVAAAGGVAGSALAYRLYVEWLQEPMLVSAWPIVAGIDIAFVYFIARAIFQRHPAVPFLLLIAVASNTIGVLAIAPTYLAADRRAGGAAVLMAAGIGIAAWLRRRHVRQFWPYIWIGGGLSWLALYVEGFHPALALVPIVPFMPHVRRSLEHLFDDDEDARRGTARHFEHVWHYHVQVALLLFGLVNAGVMLGGYGGGTWATLAASLGGRTLGIAAGVGLAVAIGLHLPTHLRWRDVTVMALASGCGLTFTLFFATTLFPAGPALAQLKLGALFTAVAIPLAWWAARLLHVGRYRVASPHAHSPRARHAA